MRQNNNTQTKDTIEYKIKSLPFDSLACAKRMTKRGVPKKTAEAFAEEMIQGQKEYFDNFATKKDLVELKKDLTKEIADARKETRDVKKDLTKEIADVRKETRDARKDLTKEIADVRKDLTTEIEYVRKDLTKEITDVRKDLTKEITDVRKDLTKEITDVRKDMQIIKQDIIFKLGSLMVVCSGILIATIKL